MGDGAGRGRRDGGVPEARGAMEGRQGVAREAAAADGARPRETPQASDRPAVLIDRSAVRSRRDGGAPETRARGAAGAMAGALP